MKSLVLDENLISALNRVCNDNVKLEKARGKVENILIEFAEHKRVGLKQLRIVDVSDDRGNIQPRFRLHVESAHLLPAQTEKRYRQYVAEKLSIINRLIRAIIGTGPMRRKSRRTLPESILLAQVPEYVRPLLKKLSKPRGEAARNNGKDSDLVKALTVKSQLLLLALCRVDRAFNISRETSPINCLLVEHHFDIVSEMRALALSTAEFHEIKKAHYRLLDKLKIRRVVPPPVRWEMGKWPQPLRGEYCRFFSLASGEIKPSAGLRASADKHHFSLKVCREATLRFVQTTIEHTLPLIPHDGTLGIADLINLSPIEVMTEEGVKVESRNLKVDALREHERAKCTRVKPLDYDSDLFASFLTAIKMIASRTGYGHLLKDFRKAYKAVLDKQGRQDRKAAKKKAIRRRWLDDELERLGIEYDYIISKRLYERKPGRSRAEADHAMRLCLFYPQILTLRQVGYRQQAIRNCIVDDNIKFLPDGTVILYFPKDKVKNARTLNLEIKPTQDGVHERLRNVLIMYRRKVLPYVQKRGGALLGRHFFTHFDGNSGRFERFDSAVDYYTYFVRMVREFINVHELEAGFQDSITPHFLRGVCTDWMIIDLKMSYEEAATVLGDTVAMLTKEYLDRDRPWDATAAFDRVNKVRRAERKEADTDNSTISAKRVKELEAALRSKDQLVEELTNKLTQVQLLSENVSNLVARLPSPQEKG